MNNCSNKHIVKVAADLGHNIGDDLLEGMVKLRFQKSAMTIASARYSAWIDAGSPDLNSLINSKDESSRFLQGYQLTLEEP